MITLTDSAASKASGLLADEPEGSVLRVEVQPGGCSGFTYGLMFDDEVGDDDVITTYDGLRVVSDPTSAQLLVGATLDYKEGLQETGFSINNPNAQRTCGCGQSFS